MTDLLAETQATYTTFTESFTSIVLGTVDTTGAPNSSYTPYVRDESGDFFVFVSGLSEHTNNMETSGTASVLLLEDEATCANIFARRRLTFSCTASLVPREDEQWSTIADSFTDRFGKMINFFRSAPDFRIIRLHPQSGLFVIGFGQAFTVSGPRMNTLTHLNNNGGHGGGSGHGHPHGSGGHPHGSRHPHG